MVTVARVSDTLAVESFEVLLDNGFYLWHHGHGFTITRDFDGLIIHEAIVSLTYDIEIGITSFDCWKGRIVED
jgi:hypothetical protein